MARSVSDQWILLALASGPTVPPSMHPGRRPQGVEPVGLGVHPGLGHGVGVLAAASAVGGQALGVEATSRPAASV